MLPLPESFPLNLPNVPLLMPATTPRTRPPMLDEEDEELELSPDLASSGRSRSSAIMSSRLIELLTSLLLIALLTEDVPPPAVADSSRLLPLDANRADDMDDTTAEGDSVADAPIPVLVVVGVELVVEEALPSVEDCCLRLRYSVMESLRFGVIGVVDGPAPVVDAVSVPDDAATRAGLSRGSELAVLVYIFG